MFEAACFDVNLANKTFTNVTSMAKMFKEYQGTSIDMSNCDVSNSENNLEFIYKCPALVNLIPPVNISSSITVEANQLPPEGYVKVIESLAEMEELQVLTVGAINLDKIPESSIALAITKNWSVA